MFGWKASWLLMASLVVVLSIGRGSTKRSSPKLDSAMQNPKEYKGLKFLGTYLLSGKPERTGPEARSGTDMSSSEYYFSIEKQTHAEAKVKCPVLTEGRGVLVKIESPEEDQRLHDLILEPSTNKPGEIFWTDGLSDYKGKWVWGSNGAAIGPHKNFGIKPGPAGYLAFKSISASPKNFEWVPIYDREEKHYYICEVEPEDVAMPCFRENDVVIALDGSEPLFSQEPPNYYELVTSFAANLGYAFRSPSRVAFATYIKTGKVEFGLNQSLSAEQVKTRITTHVRDPDTSLRKTVSRQAEGIIAGVGELERNKRTGVRQKLVVLANYASNLALADWYTNEYMPNTVKASTEAARKGVDVFVVSIGMWGFDTRSMYYGEPMTMAGNISENVFSVNGAIDLSKRVREISIRVCTA